MKSYGPAPTFLMLTGYEQVRSIAAAISGDWEAARAVDLVLPETGVCSVSGSIGGAISCCGSSEEAVGASCSPTEAPAFLNTGQPVIALTAAGGSSGSSCCG